MVPPSNSIDLEYSLDFFPLFEFFLGQPGPIHHVVQALLAHPGNGGNLTQMPLVFFNTRAR